MNLPYAFRLICLIAVTFGAIQLVLQLLLAANARSILNLLRSASARQRERLLYLLQISPLIAAALFAGALLVPQYLRHEPNAAAESVSMSCLLLAALVFLWFAYFALDGLRLMLRTLRFTHACRRAGTTSAGDLRDIPIVTLPGSDSIFALAGFVRPVILISRILTEGNAFEPAALELALDHERAHAAHLDNWKRLSLSFLPRLRSRGDFWLRQWQEAAEWAADDEAVGGDPARSLLLAETILRVARSTASTRPPIICTAFHCETAGLATRIERLLEHRSVPRQSRSMLLILAGLAIAAVALAAAVSPWIYAVSEHILHLG